jgi:CheY-like chemotaxis protein
MARLSGPIIPAVDGASEERRIRLVDAAGGVSARRSITVLHVGDMPEDTFLLSQLVRALPSFAATFVAAGTREAALSALTRHACDVVLCEFWMDGRTTMALINEIKAAAHVPVILTSSLDNDDIELIGRRAGADGLLSKADLAVATLDRVFSTVLPRRAAPRRDAATALRGLMASLSAIGMTLRAGDKEAGKSDERQTKRALIRSIVDLDEASREGAGVQRFDAVPSFADAVRKQRLRAMAGGDISFVEPALPISIETSPTLYADLIDGFFAEAGDAAAAGSEAHVEMTADAGRLIVHIHTNDPSERPVADSESTAVVGERRLLVESLSRACGGDVTFSDLLGHRLSVPLRLGSL